jgi:GH25 family lysozyme M1 (1,4-beta-N-acetylmuramidase)
VSGISFVIPVACSLLAGCGSAKELSVASSASAVTEKCGASANGAVQGVDVSDDQGSFDWAAAHVSFGYAQVSDGLYSPQWSFDGNWSRMKSAGVLRGAYQFFEPDQDEVAQANMVIAKVGRLGPGDLPAMIDVEVTRGVGAATLGARVRTWLELVEAGTGRKPIIYTGSYFWEDNVGTDLSGYPIWIAAYGPACPSIPDDGWTNWTIWQYSDGDNKLDHDVFNGTLAELQGLSAGSAASGDITKVGSSVVPNRDGRLEAFGRGVDNALWHAWQETPGGTWSGWSSLGGALASEPLVIQNEDGRLEAFTLAADGSTNHIWQTTAPGKWSEWVTLGGDVASKLALGANQDGRIEVFGVKSDGSVATTFQTTPNGSWSDWYSLGGTLVGDPSVAANQDGRLELFGRTAADTVVHSWQTSANGSWSSPWSSLGGAITSDVTVVTNKDGRVEVFGLASDSSVQHLWQTKAGATWASWSSLGGSLATTPAVAMDTDGRLEVFGLAPDETVQHIWQTNLGGGPWSSWSPRGTWRGVSDLTATINLDGRLELFVVGTDDHLDHCWQKTPGGTWTPWSGLGGELL